eukprot:gene4453-4709_t
MGLPAFLPKSLLPFKIRDLYHQQADDQLVGSELPVVVEEVVPERRRLVLNCSAAVAARKAALKPGDLVTGVVTEVQSSYVFVGLDGLDSDNNWSILHRNHASVSQDFKSMHAVFGVGEREELDGSLLSALSASTQQPEREEHAAPPYHGQLSKTARPMIKTEPVIDREPLYDSAFSGYVAGGRLGVVMAAAVWNGQDKWAVDESASGFVDSVKGHVEALGVAGKSVDAEQDWWSAGPLAWGPEEERQQWKEEQQLQVVQQGAAGATGVGEPDAVGVQQDGFMDVEQQWLLPPVLSEPAV